MNSTATLTHILNFLTEIGIPHKLSTLENNTFLPGLELQQGTLHIDADKLISPTDILHEAGHIAVALPEHRPLMTGDLMLAKTEREGEELAAIVWSYAAALHIGLDADTLFHSEGYKGEGDWLAEQYQRGNYLFLPLLVWMGLCDNPDGNGNGYPKMKKWLREPAKEEVAVVDSAG